MSTRRSISHRPIRAFAALACATLMLHVPVLRAQSASAPLPAGVTAAHANGFSIAHRVRVAAPPARVFEALSTQIDRWWNPQHSYSGKAENLRLEARAGGCFCETLPNGGSVEHMRVVNVMPGTMLRLVGGLGPLQAGGVTAHLTWQLAPDSTGTALTATYVAGGYIDGGLDKLAGVVSFVLNEQVQRLKRVVETGKPTP